MISSAEKRKLAIALPLQWFVLLLLGQDLHLYEPEQYEPHELVLLVFLSHCADIEIYFS